MTKNDVDFDDWCDILQINLMDEGVDFLDKSSVREDYDNGRNLFDVMEEIADEY